MAVVDCTTNREFGMLGSEFGMARVWDKILGVGLLRKLSAESGSICASLGAAIFEAQRSVGHSRPLEYHRRLRVCRTTKRLLF